MAPTPQQAVKDAIKTAGSERELKFRDSIHLPFHQVGMSENLPAIYLCEADVPEYRDSDWGTSKPEWVGSKVELLSMEEIIGDTNVMDNADHSFVGGSGVGINAGGSTFVWGNDVSLHSNIVTGSELFIIGTGSTDENYQLGVNNHNPDVVGGMGAHIVGSIDAGSSPLRLGNLNNSDSQDALCVDNDGNVFVSNYKLDPYTSVDRVQVITFERYKPNTGMTNNSVQDWRYRSTATSPVYGYAHADHGKPWGNLSSSYPSCPVLVFPYQGSDDNEGPLATVSAPRAR